MGRGGGGVGGHKWWRWWVVMKRGFECVRWYVAGVVAVGDYL